MPDEPARLGTMEGTAKGFMSLYICRCCGGKMTAGSPRNPNICISCEQLLDDDCAELEKLIASVADSETARRAVVSELPADSADEKNRETYFGPM